MVWVLAFGLWQAGPSQSNFLAANGRRLWFGLGMAKGAERVKVVWPEGRTTER